MSRHTNTFVNRNLDDDTHHGIIKEFSIIFSSATANYVSPNMDKFSVTLNNPISVPKEANSCSIALYSANVWNSSPNIITNKNNVFSFKFLGVDRSVTLDLGLYSLPDLNQTIGELCFQTYGMPQNTFTFSGNTATQKVIVTIASAGYQMDFTKPFGFQDILGFDPLVYPVAPSVAGEIVFAPNIANFNNINAFLISLDLVNDGLPVNALSGSILSIVPITAPPNSLIYYEPNTPIFINTDHIIGKQISQLNFGITNELLQPIIVREDWSLSVTIKYEF